MKCNCIEEYNEILKTQGLELDLVYFLDGSRAPTIKIPISVIDKVRKGKVKASYVIGSFCPFCGCQTEQEAR